MLAKAMPLGIEGNRTIAEDMNKSAKAAQFRRRLFVFSQYGRAGRRRWHCLRSRSRRRALAHCQHAALAQLAVKACIGLATYNAVKIPLHWMGDKLFGLDKETTHDRIVSLQREHEAGKAISREQVLSVFAGANPQLDRFIAAEYGKQFDKLDGR